MTANSNALKNGRTGFDISSAGLHIIAMASMLIDHAMKTVVEEGSWIFVLGRLAFPIFAFMTAEGYFHTRNFRKYVTRVVIFAFLSEIPYDLMKSGQPFDRYDQNVLWTFLIALICMRVIDLVKSKGNKIQFVLTAIAVSAVGLVLGMVFSVDYGGLGVLTVLIFYFLRKPNWKHRIIQLVLMLIIHGACLGGLGYGVVIGNIELPLQGFAVLALIPIWLYRGRQGYHSKPFQYFCYAFYPVHMALLYVLMTLAGKSFI